MELSIQNLESDVEEKQVVNVKCALKFRSIKCMGKVHNKFVQTALYIFEFLAEPDLARFLPKTETGSGEEAP